MFCSADDFGTMGFEDIEAIEATINRSRDMDNDGKLSRNNLRKNKLTSLQIILILKLCRPSSMLNSFEIKFFLHMHMIG